MKSKDLEELKLHWTINAKIGFKNSGPKMSFLGKKRQESEAHLLRDRNSTKCDNYEVRQCYVKHQQITKTEKRIRKMKMMYSL